MWLPVTCPWSQHPPPTFLLPRGLPKTDFPWPLRNFLIDAASELVRSVDISVIEKPCLFRCKFVTYLLLIPDMQVLSRESWLRIPPNPHLALVTRGLVAPRPYQPDLPQPEALRAPGKEYGSPSGMLNSGTGIFLVVQWLRLRVPNARGLGSIPDRELDPTGHNWEFTGGN